MTTEAQRLGLRAALAIGLAASLTRLICLTIGLGDIAAAYGVVVAVLVVRPDFCRWPALLYPVLLVIATVAMAVAMRYEAHKPIKTINTPAPAAISAPALRLR